MTSDFGLAFLIFKVTVYNRKYSTCQTFFSSWSYPPSFIYLNVSMLSMWVTSNDEKNNNQKNMKNSNPFDKESIDLETMLNYSGTAWGTKIKLSVRKRAISSISLQPSISPIYISMGVAYIYYSRWMTAYPLDAFLYHNMQFANPYLSTEIFSVILVVVVILIDTFIHSGCLSLSLYDDGWASK